MLTFTSILLILMQSPLSGQSTNPRSEKDVHERTRKQDSGTDWATVMGPPFLQIYPTHKVYGYLEERWANGDGYWVRGHVHAGVGPKGLFREWKRDEKTEVSVTATPNHGADDPDARCTVTPWILARDKTGRVFKKDVGKACTVLLAARVTQLGLRKALKKGYLKVVFGGIEGKSISVLLPGYYIEGFLRRAKELATGRIDYLLAERRKLPVAKRNLMDAQEEVKRRRMHVGEGESRLIEFLDAKRLVRKAERKVRELESKVSELIWRLEDEKLELRASLKGELPNQEEVAACARLKTVEKILKELASLEAK